jgi:hypothetical protein
MCSMITFAISSVFAEYDALQLVLLPLTLFTPILFRHDIINPNGAYGMSSLQGGCSHSF